MIEAIVRWIQNGPRRTLYLTREEHTGIWIATLLVDGKQGIGEAVNYGDALELALSHIIAQGELI